MLGVHVLGTSATDLVHIGQAVMAAGAGGLDFLVTAVFNYPTFAESYKVAALDADNRIKAMKAFGETMNKRAACWPPLIEGRERKWKFRPRRVSWRARRCGRLLGEPLVDDRRVRTVAERAGGGHDARPVPAVDRGSGPATAGTLGGVTRENGVRLSVGRDKMEVGLHKSGGVPPL